MAYKWYEYNTKIYIHIFTTILSAGRVFFSSTNIFIKYINVCFDCDNNNQEIIQEENEVKIIIFDLGKIVDDTQGIYIN